LLKTIANRVQKDDPVSWWLAGQQSTEMARRGAGAEEKEHSMTDCRARTIWANQCAATSGIRTRFGAQSALDYLVSEKLMDFAEAAGDRGDSLASRPPLSPK
jgi:hypothetical protein